MIEPLPSTNKAYVLIPSMCLHMHAHVRVHTHTHTHTHTHDLEDVGTESYFLILSAFQRFFKNQMT